MMIKRFLLLLLLASPLAARELQQAPTAEPTESPAPSPSPSANPTGSPTVTIKPTAKPTSEPTESPAPSPSPSTTPTKAPTQTPSALPSMQPTTTPFPTGMPSGTPTDKPSAPPSCPPSVSPSLSAAPSALPSATPSASPSMSPSVSVAPSAVPSLAPSLSAAPSSAPSYVGNVEDQFTVELDLDAPLNATQQAAFSKATASFLDSYEFERGGVSDMVVTVTSQEMMQGSRRLVENRDLQQVGDLQISFAASGVYTGSDNSFDLFDQFNSTFHDGESRQLWIRMLGNEDPLFLPLRPTPAGIVLPEGTTNEPSGGLSKSGFTIVVLAVAASLMMGVGAAYYAVRQHGMSVRGTELRSPGKHMDIQASTSSEHEPPSPNTLEKGMTPEVEQSDVMCNAMDGVMGALPFSNTFFSGRLNEDPPSDAEAREKRLFPDPQSDRESQVSTSYVKKVTAAIEEANESRSMPKKKASPKKLRSKRADVEVESHELMLTKSMGGTLGAAAVDGSYHGGTTPSDFSSFSQAKSFFSSMVGGKPESPKRSQNIHRTNTKHAGWTPGPNKSRANVKRTGSLDSRQRAGLYDVFAPAGPIGIVVDTTKDGPAVHSLKNTSPMLGLINPGDLIVGLDDEDTRSMTAATLTRLMARKANQKDRKITLLASENY